MKLKTLFYSIVVLLLLFCSFTFIRTLYFDNKVKSTEFIPTSVASPTKEALERYSEGLKIKTISNSNYKETDFKEFDKFIIYLKNTYPILFSKAEFTQINKYNLVFKIKGQINNAKPNLLTAHYDVVGVKDEAGWIQPPFTGYYNDEYILARGTLDDKSSFFAILEATNELLKNDFKPQADLYLAFSHCEETGSPEGAKKIIEYFKEKNIQFSTALDEGGRVINKNGQYLAFVGTAEKGRLLVKVTTSGTGKHASTPDKNSATEKLAKLILKFKSQNYNTQMSDDIYQYYIHTFDSYDFWTKYLIANKDVFKSLLYKKLSKNAEDNARINSTFAITILEASNTANVISSNASMIIDIRVLPIHNPENIKNYIENTVYKMLNKDEVKIEYLDTMQPCKASPINTPLYKMLEKDINTIFPNITIAPYMVLGATDARDYAKVSDNTYRFLPIILSDEEAALMHADNEKITIENWARMIEFYKNYIKRR